MAEILKKILFIKTEIWHFVITCITFIIFCTIIYIFLIPLFHFLCFGSGQDASKINELPVNIFIQDWFALIITLAILLFLLFKNINIEKFGNAKSYLLTIIAITILYLFKIPMANKLIELF